MATEPAMMPIPVGMRVAILSLMSAVMTAAVTLAGRHWWRTIRSARPAGVPALTWTWWVLAARQHRTAYERAAVFGLDQARCLRAGWKPADVLRQREVTAAYVPSPRVAEIAELLPLPAFTLVEQYLFAGDRGGRAGSLLLDQDAETIARWVQAAGPLTVTCITAGLTLAETEALAHRGDLDEAMVRSLAALVGS